MVKRFWFLRFEFEKMIYVVDNDQSIHIMLMVTIFWFHRFEFEKMIYVVENDY